MKVIFGVLCSLVVIAVADSQNYNYDAPGGGSGGFGGGSGSGGAGGGGGGGGGNGGSSEPASYNFQYDINDAESGNNFGHQESRDGSRAEGTYYVQLPDSRLMTVEYYADETGYHPTITFDGEAQFPDDSSSRGSQGQPSSQYQPPSQQPAPPPPSQQYGQPSFGK